VKGPLAWVSFPLHYDAEGGSQVLPTRDTLHTGTYLCHFECVLGRNEATLGICNMCIGTKKGPEGFPPGLSAMDAGTLLTELAYLVMPIV
jgi:hypothetical protein